MENDTAVKSGALGLEELAMPLSDGDDLFLMLYCEALRRASEAPRLKPIERARFDGMLGEELGARRRASEGKEAAHV